MELKLRLTDDGSHTLYRKDIDENYHSTHGAVQESEHVFIKNGLNYCHKALFKNHISILEVGFGTGLNCFLSYLYAKKNKVRINYSGLEINPLNDSIISQLNYCSNNQEQLIFNNIHQFEWGKWGRVSDFFKIKKISSSLQTCKFENKFDLVYFDAFGPRVEHQLWNKKWYSKIKNFLNDDSVLVTYCAKGSVRRDLISIGYNVERLEGPKGKREMLRAST